MALPESLAVALRGLREEGATQELLAEAGGLGLRTIRKWEKGVMPVSLTLAHFYILWYERARQRQSHSSS